MPAKATRSLPKSARRPQGRPPSDKSIVASAADMHQLGEHMEEMRQEAQRLADSVDLKALQWHRQLLAEVSDAWWSAADRLAFLPARSWAGMAAKASAINSIAEERERTQKEDIAAADCLCRLAISLSADVLRWSGKRQ